MHRKPDAPALGRLAGHLAMGAGLGTALAVTLLFGSGTIWNMLINASDPRTSTLLFVWAFASVIGVGATITGLIFEQVERRH